MSQTERRTVGSQEIREEPEPGEISCAGVTFFSFLSVHPSVLMLFIYRRSAMKAYELNIGLLEEDRSSDIR